MVVNRHVITRKRFWLVLAVVLLIAFVAAVHGYAHREYAHSDPSSQPNTERVWYFAYGSNMPARYLINVRHATVFESRFAQLSDYAVKYNLPGIPFVEPHFASLVKQPGEVASGVVHLISRDDLPRILASEADIYNFVHIEIDTPSGKLQAVTLTTDNLSASGPISKRYQSLILEGLQSVQAPESVIDEARQHPTTSVPVVSPLFGAFIQCIVILSSTLSQ